MSVQLLQTTAVLGNGGVFTSQWFDTQNFGGFVAVELQASSDQSSAALGVVINESDNSADANMTSLVTSGTLVANTQLKLSATIRRRFVQVVYTNGVTPQTRFDLVASGLFQVPLDVVVGVAAIAITGASIIAGAVVVKATPARLFKVLVTSVNGANPINITDGVGGTIIGIVPAAAALGTILDFSMPALTSINIPQTAAAGNLTISVY